MTQSLTDYIEEHAVNYEDDDGHQYLRLNQWVPTTIARQLPADGWEYKAQACEEHSYWVKPVEL